GRRGTGPLSRGSPGAADRGRRGHRGGRRGPRRPAARAGGGSGAPLRARGGERGEEAPRRHLDPDRRDLPAGPLDRSPPVRGLGAPRPRPGSRRSAVRDRHALPSRGRSQDHRARPLHHPTLPVRRRAVIFRKVALERLSSPEQLDQLMQVTDPKGWFALGALGLLLLTSLAWGVFGSIPTQAHGEGILLRQGGVSSLVAAENGQVEEILVGVGDVIEKGQVVARIRQEELLRQIQDSRDKLADARSEYRDLLRYAGDQRRLRDQDLAQQGINLRRSIQTLERQVELIRDRIASERDLLKDGLITKQTLLTSEQSLNTAEDQLASVRLELNGLELKRIEADQQVDQQIQTRESQIRDLEIELRE